MWQLPDAPLSQPPTPEKPRTSLPWSEKSDGSFNSSFLSVDKEEGDPTCLQCKLNFCLPFFFFLLLLLFLLLLTERGKNSFCVYCLSSKWLFKAIPRGIHFTFGGHSNSVPADETSLLKFKKDRQWNEFQLDNKVEVARGIGRWGNVKRRED